jgi:hypothetical protein
VGGRYGNHGLAVPSCEIIRFHHAEACWQLAAFAGDRDLAHSGMVSAQGRCRPRRVTMSAFQRSLAAHGPLALDLAAHRLADVGLGDLPSLGPDLAMASRITFSATSGWASSW